MEGAVMAEDQETNVFELNDEDWEKFMRLLEKAHGNNQALENLMARKPLWEDK
jgi:uncharacterized protein (DUF1778 family)